MKKIKAMELYNVLSEIVSSGTEENPGLNREEKIQLILLRGKLTDITDETENIRNICKKDDPEPEDKSKVNEWLYRINKAINESVEKWGIDEVEIETGIFTQEQVMRLIECNKLIGKKEDVIYNGLLKKSKEKATAGTKKEK